ncbi:MAG: cysteine desulfurase [Gammaproteobacteria bacterium]|jgi:cysteine desulfurase/selenocysteine lyase|nr:cysteine desulfurase CsdA [Chromatiales bacterium]MCP4924716.1 cysteine desulfurase [Gammaproteobacteria bacterium]MDP7154452.1 cysteine desulfurase [Gammaproteobacteria bacterium]MDP7296304.1 cysteine desulfurase [Gammaproteobacteria bacterium]MDP7420028.1 cysteine desulfurase [Gammaproteobacteria bacterium]
MTATDPDIEKLRLDFPILAQEINGHRLAFLDSAASSQRPRSVIEAVSHYYEHDHANVHRGVHTLSHRATEAYEGAREKVRRFINASSSREIIFTRGTTDAINLLAASFGQSIEPGDEIIISHLEHHSNIVPWQMLCERNDATLKVIPINERGEIILDEYHQLLGPRTRLVAVSHVSNALGTVNPVEQIIAAAKERNIPVLIDGAQAVPHQAVDVTALNCDFYAFSGHKMFGPTGIGVFYAREEWLERLPPYQGGGDMILTVSFAGTTYNDLPYKFEAGTPNIAGAIGLGAAIDYLLDIGMDKIQAHETALLDYATREISTVDGIQLIGTAAQKAGVLSFNLDGIHPHDLGTVLDHQGIAIRTGHHCAMPVMEFFGIAGTARASLALYNCRQDIEQLIHGLQLAIGMFRS